MQAHGPAALQAPGGQSSPFPLLNLTSFQRVCYTFMCYYNHESVEGDTLQDVGGSVDSKQ
jgi:hypothetical protein